MDPIDLSQKPEPSLPASPDGGLHLFIENPRVEELPECGEITFRYVRGPITEVEPLRGMPGRCSVDLTLTEICKVKACEPEDTKRMEDDLDNLFEEASAEEKE